MNEGTRFGPTVHLLKVVQDSDAYGPQIMDGKIKRVAPLPSLRS